MKAKDIKVTLAIVATVLVLSGCANVFCEQCRLPATGQGDWYRNNGFVAKCDDFSGFDGLTDVPPGQDGRFMAGCSTEGRFEVNGPLVVDSCTGLTWQKTTSSRRTWVEALIFARNLELGVTATGSVLWSYEADGRALPQVGDFWVVTNGGDDPVCVIQTTEIRILPFDEVGEEYARDGGEGDCTLGSWREMYWKYIVSECSRIGREPSRKAPLVMERFRVVYRERLSVVPDRPRFNRGP